MQHHYGGTFVCKRLLCGGGEGDETYVTFPALSRTQPFSKVAELAALDVNQNCLWCPTSPTFRAVDSIAVSDGGIYLFQCTKKVKHGYNYNGITEVLNALKNVKDFIKGVFLVVPNVATFSAVRWQDLNGMNSADAIWPEELQQWKMLRPVT
jgi:hypothetical protein